MSRFAVLDTRSVSIPARTAPPSGPTPTPASKPDATAKFVDSGFDLSGEPIVVAAALDPFDPAAVNPIAELGVICLPSDAPVPDDLSTLVGSAAFPQAGADVSGVAPGTPVKFPIANSNPGTDARTVKLLLIGIYAD